MANIVVMGSNYSTTLGIIRAVGEAGHKVALISTSRECTSIAKRSKYVVDVCTCNEEYDEIFCALETMRNGRDKTLVIPTNDYGAALLDLHMQELAEHYQFFNVNHSSGELLSLMDKYRQKNLAKQCGLSVADGCLYAGNKTGIAEALSAAKYPCVVKAVSTVGYLKSKTLLSVCNNEKDLGKAMEAACEKQWSQILIEKYLQIEKEYAVYGLALNGRVAMPACLHTWRSGHGSHKGVTAEGVMLHPDCLGDNYEKLKTFVRSSGLNGLFCIDLILSNDQFYFVEMNMRYGASGYAVTAGGVNLPGMYVDSMISDLEIDEDVSMAFEPHFLNEKVELDDYRNGYITWKDYKAHQKEDKIRFIQSTDDPGPWKSFQALETRKHLAKLIKR